VEKPGFGTTGFGMMLRLWNVPFIADPESRIPAF